MRDRHDPGLLGSYAHKRREMRETLEKRCADGMRAHIDKAGLPLDNEQVDRLVNWQRYQLREVLQRIEDETLSNVANMLMPINAKEDSNMIDSETGEELKL